MTGRKILKGAFILTSFGILTRVIGFVFRIILSRTIGSESLGLYQLVVPLVMVCHAIAISGFEVAATRFCAKYIKEPRLRYTYLILCFAISFALSLICCGLVCLNSKLIAARIFCNSDTAPLIRILALSIPFSCVHSMTYAYYLGKEKPFIPAASQFFEQIIRFVSLLIIVKIYAQRNLIPTARIGAQCLMIGEIASALFCITVISFTCKPRLAPLANPRVFVREVLRTAVPINANRLFTHLLQSLEVALIPMMLVIYGENNSTALKTLGIISGMALPVIMFPATLTNSIALMLVPSIAQKEGNSRALKVAATKIFYFSITFGGLCILAFETIGARLGAAIFSEPALYNYIKILAFICPFCYLSTTYKSMLNGLGHTCIVFVISMLSELIIISSIVFVIPILGIIAYIYGILISQVVSSILMMIAFRRTLPQS